MQPSPGPATDLLGEVRTQLSETERAIRDHRFLEAIERGEVSRETLGSLAGEQLTVISSDRRSFAALAARFPGGPAGELFLSMAEGEGVALQSLGAFADWLGLGPEDLAEYEPKPAGQAYTAFVSWLALNGSRADVALAFAANLAAWGANCGRVAAALSLHYGAGEDAVAFFDFFAEPPPDLEQRLLEAVDQGLAADESALRARRATRLLQAYELMFWDSLDQRG